MSPYRRKWSKAYRERNREAIRGYQKKYTLAHAEAIAERSKAWRENNRERFAELARNYRERFKQKHGCSTGTKFMVGATVLLKNDQEGVIHSAAYPCSGGKGKGSRYKVPCRMSASGEVVHLWNTDIARVY